MLLFSACTNATRRALGLPFTQHLIERRTTRLQAISSAGFGDPISLESGVNSRHV
ncbi:MAG: hypothetical protein ACREV5_19155 [Steroidobacter sp.]